MAMPTDPESLLLVGRIWRAHGIRGEMKIIPETDSPGRFQDLTVIYTGSTAANADPYGVESVRFQPTKRGPIVIVKLNGIDSREDAESMRKSAVFAREEDLPPLEEGEFFIHDLVGLEVVTVDGARVGSVQDVIDGPAQPILVVAREEGGSAMIPAVDEFIENVDPMGRRITIRPIEGLLDL